MGRLLPPLRQIMPGRPFALPVHAAPRPGQAGPAPLGGATPWRMRGATASLLVALLLAAVADLLRPALPALAWLAGAAVLLAACAAIAALARPGARRTASLLMAALPPALVLPPLALLQDGAPRGLIAARLPVFVAVQDAVFPPRPEEPLPTEALQRLLAEPDARPRRHPATEDEALFNAILLHRQDAPLPAARALALALRLSSEPRPDALLLQEALWNSGIASVREALAALPGQLAPTARAQVEATRLADPAARAAALAGLLDRVPEVLEAAPALAQALLRAALPEGPTVAVASRIAAILDAFAAGSGTEDFTARFLDRAWPGRLAEEMRGLDWLRETAARRLSVTAAAPPPGMPDLPMLVRLTPPEPWRAVQVLEHPGTPAEAWGEVPQRAGDPVPTLLLPQPWRRRDLRLRYLDRDGEASPVVSVALDPVPAMREAAQRALVRQGPFALYLPGRLAPTQLNALPIAAHLRPGLSAVEWHTEAERRTKRVDLAVPDMLVLAGTVPRFLVEFEVPPNAKVLFLTAIYADGTRSAVQELPIR
jgi:hypothetical protein